jgi:hypothetical protein
MAFGLDLSDDISTSVAGFDKVLDTDNQIDIVGVNREIAP